MNISKQKVMFLYSHLIKSSNTQNNSKSFLKFVLVSIIAPVKISMMPSALPPSTELPSPHQRPKIGFSIDSIVGDKRKRRDEDNDITSEFNSKILNRSHPAPDSDKHHHESHLPLQSQKDFQKAFPNVYKFDLLNQFRNVQHPLVNLHHQIRQQLHFNRIGADNGNAHSPGSNQLRVSQSNLRYNFQVPPANTNRSVQASSDDEKKGSEVNSRVTLSPTDDNNCPSASRTPSPSDNRQSPPVPRCHSPESRSAGSPANPSRAIEHHHNMPNPVQLIPPQQFAPFHSLGGYPPIPGHPPGHPLWGHPPNVPHHPNVSHPLYPWIMARHARMFPPRFPDSELPAFLFQPFRKPKRIRTAFSPSQLLRLEHSFEKNHYVVGTERKQRAKSLSLSETQVKVWFQNRRTKHKRTEQEEGETSGGKRHSSEHLLSGSNLSSTATSADSSTKHYSEEMSEDEEEIIMDDEYSGDEEEMVQLHTSLHSNP